MLCTGSKFPRGLRRQGSDSHSLCMLCEPGCWTGFPCGISVWWGNGASGFDVRAAQGTQRACSRHIASGAQQFLDQHLGRPQVDGLCACSAFLRVGSALCRPRQRPAFACACPLGYLSSLVNSRQKMAQWAVNVCTLIDATLAAPWAMAWKGLPGGLCHAVEDLAVCHVEHSRHCWLQVLCTQLTFWNTTVFYQGPCPATCCTCVC